jgi:hypothetical protein
MSPGHFSLRLGELFVRANRRSRPYYDAARTKARVLAERSGLWWGVEFFGVLRCAQDDGKNKNKNKNKSNCNCNCKSNCNCNCKSNCNSKSNNSKSNNSKSTCNCSNNSKSNSNCNCNCDCKSDCKSRFPSGMTARKLKSKQWRRESYVRMGGFLAGCWCQIVTCWRAWARVLTTTVGLPFPKRSRVRSGA